MRDRAVEARATAQPDRCNPWDLEDAPRLGDLGASTTTPDPEVSAADRAEQYAQWAERMRAKRERTKAAFGPADEPAAGTGAHWSTDALYAESRHVEEREAVSRPNPWRTRELLSTLQLEDGASLDDIGAAYRRLAKTHHPDRFVDADEATREFHAQRMLDINAAYSSLKALRTADR